jgi:putative ABC transport system permease protein
MDRLTVIGSAVAIGSLLLGCVGVGNLIVAEVTSRRFEFGVLRAIGAPRSMLGRLVAGQTLIVGLVGCAAGTMLGTEFALVERGLHQRLVGVTYPLHLAWDVIAWGTLVVLAAALLAALPTIWRLMRYPPRALLARLE